MARLIAQRLEQRLGQPIIFEYRPGAGSAIAAAYVARQPADGYTILYATSTTMAINVSVHKQLAYDPVKDFAPIALFAVTPFVLVVNASLPIRSVADLVAFAKSKPGALSYASNGPGGASHLFAELTKTMLGIEMTHVPYKGNAPALNDVVAGHVSLMFVDPFGVRAIGARGQAARARRHHGEAGVDGARAAAARRGGPAGIRRRELAHVRGARGDAEADRAAALRGDRRHHQGARRGGGDLASAASSRPPAARRSSLRGSCRARSTAGARWCARPAPPGSSREAAACKPGHDLRRLRWRCSRSPVRRLSRRRRTIPTAR